MGWGEEEGVGGWRMEGMEKGSTRVLDACLMREPRITHQLVKLHAYARVQLPRDSISVINRYPREHLSYRDANANAV